MKDWATSTNTLWDLVARRVHASGSRLVAA